MNLTMRTAFRLKNFRDHMGIRDNITLAGIIKRYTRKYPQVYALAKGSTVLGGVYFIMMSLFPGTSMPLQQAIKLSLLAFTRLAAQVWYYNIITPEPQQYLIKLNEIALAAIDAQLYDLPFLVSLLGEIKALVQEEKRSLKRDSFLDLLIYSQIILQNIIRYEKKMLLEKDLLQYYEWVFATVFSGLQSSLVTEKERKHLRLIYPLIQYLLNFADAQGKARCVHIYHQFVTTGEILRESHDSFRWKVTASALYEAPFKAALKQLYAETSSSELREEIVRIFERLNLIYQHQQASS